MAKALGLSRDSRALYWVSVPLADVTAEPAPGAPPPSLKLEKNMIVWRKIVIVHTKYPTIFAPPSAVRIFFYWFLVRPLRCWCAGTL
jgi:hypothetical protein